MPQAGIQSLYAQIQTATPYVANITFNDKYHNIKGVSYYDASQATDALRYTKRGTTGNVYNVDLFPDTTVAVGDAIIFAPNYTLSGKVNELKVNLDVGVAATTWDGVWEYCVGGTNAIPGWSALTVTSDGTNKLTTTGVQSVIFDVPADWENYVLTQVGDYVYYCFLVRFRVTSVSGQTEGGHIANSSNCMLAKGYTIYAYGYGYTKPVTMTEIYNASVAGGWGVVTKTLNNYSLTCNLEIMTGCNFSSKTEHIQFEKNWFLFGNGAFFLGEVVTGDKTRYGSSIMFYGKNVNYPSIMSSVGSRIYNSSVRIVIDPTSTSYNGYWGGIGTQQDTIVYDLYEERLRQMAFNNKNNAYIGIRASNCYMETPGAIIKNVTVYGHDICIRESSESGHYIHECDLSNPNIHPIQPYWSTNTNPWRFYAVDCNLGIFADTNKVKWNHGPSPVTGDQAVLEMYSCLLKIIDQAGNAISGATATLTDTSGTVVFSYTSNTDGYIFEEGGSLSAVTASSITDESKNWTTNQYAYREIFMTSGNGVNQRRIIKALGSTSVYSPIVPNFVTTPAISDRYIIIPYIAVKKYIPSAYTPNTGNVLSTVTDYNPFTLTITAPGYETYSKEFTITRKIDEVIKLKQSAEIRIDISGNNYLALTPEDGSTSEFAKL